MHCTNVSLSCLLSYCTYLQWDHTGDERSTGRLCAISATSCDFLIISKSLELLPASQPAAHAQQAQDSCFGVTSPSLPRPPRDHLPWTDEHPNVTAPRIPLPSDSMARSPPLAPGGSLQHPCLPPALAPLPVFLLPRWARPVPGQNGVSNAKSNPETRGVGVHPQGPLLPTTQHLSPRSHTPTAGAKCNPRAAAGTNVLHGRRSRLPGAEFRLGWQGYRLLLARWKGNSRYFIVLQLRLPWKAHLCL